MFRVGGVLSSALVACVVCAAGTPSALALDRDGWNRGHDRGGWNNSRGGDRGGWGGDRGGHSRSNFSFNISIGSGRGYCPPPRAYCPPPVRYCPPPVVVVPPPRYCPPPVAYCPPPVVIREPAYCPPAPVVVVERPRPVYIERQVIVQAPPQVIERQVVVQRDPIDTQVMVVQRPAANEMTETISTTSALASLNTASSSVTSPRGGFVSESSTVDTRLADSGALPSMDRALLYWRAGKLTAAQAALRSHLVDKPEDTKAMRLLAVMMLDDGHDTDAAALMLSAYRKDPSLAASQLDPAIYQISDARWKQLRDAALEGAQRSRTEGGWLLASVMLQSDGQKELARDMLDRSRAAGLDSGVGQSMKAALGS